MNEVDNVDGSRLPLTSEVASLPTARPTSYGGWSPYPVSLEAPVHVRSLEPDGYELAIHLKELPLLGPALAAAGGNDREALVRLVVEALAAQMRQS